MLRVCEGNIFLEACRMIGLLYIGFANKVFPERLSQKHIYAYMYVPKCCIVGYRTTSPIADKFEVLSFFSLELDYHLG